MARRRVLEKYDGYKLEWLHDSMGIIALVAVVFVLFRFVIGISVVNGDSMNPSLADGDLVVYSRLGRDDQPGDVVAIRVPSGDYYVKRVAAAGGDVVDIIDGAFYVNGGLREDARARGETFPEAGAVIYPYTVREGNVFVLGDNRTASMDSRAFGEVSLRQVRGRIFFRAGLWYAELVGRGSRDEGKAAAEE